MIILLSRNIRKKRQRTNEWHHWKIDKINLNDKKFNIKQNVECTDKKFRQNDGNDIDLKKLETCLKNGNEGEFIKLLFFVHFEELLIIKKSMMDIRNISYFWR